MSNLQPRAVSLTALFAALFILLAGVAPLPAQQAPIPVWVGVLKNSAGQPLAKATIRIAAAGHERTAKTQADGKFQFANLLPGKYKLTVDVSGRIAESLRPILVSPGSTAVITLADDNTLTFAEPQAEAGASGGQELSSQAVSELPLNKRDFSTLLLLAAGTMTDSNGANNFTQQFAINGQRGVEAVFSMDDADITDPEIGGATFTNFNVDAVQEIRSTS